MSDDDMAVLLFGDLRLPRLLRGVPMADTGEIDTVARDNQRLIVVGSDADLAAVLTRLLRSESLNVEMGFVSPRRSPATRAYRVLTGCRGGRRARRGLARRVPLIRDESGAAIVGAAEWRPSGDALQLRGEATVDDTLLFDGDVAAVRIEPTAAQPGLRAAVLSGRGRPRRWVAGRAAQLGTTGATVVRDGVPAARPVRRSTFYRHTDCWLLIR